MPTMTAEQAAAIITTAYQQVASGKGDWATLARIWRAPVMEAHDMTLDEIAAGCLHLHRTDRGFHLIPEANQKALNQNERAAAVRMGGKDNHLIAFDLYSPIWR